MQGAKMGKVSRTLGRLSVDELRAASEKYEDGDFGQLVKDKLRKKEAAERKHAAEEAERLKTLANLGASESVKAERIKKEKAAWSKECPTGVSVKFVKVDSFADTFGEFTEKFAPEHTILAFDMDGTLNTMRHHYDTIETLSSGSAKKMEKIVITARSKRAVGGCNTVLTTLGGDDGIAELFGLPDKCPDEMVNVVNSKGAWDKGDTMRSTKGLVMNEYAKAEGLVAYLRSGFVSEGAQSPEHVVFYDDYVPNLPEFARTLCFYDAWPGLKQVTAVWYGTREAEQRDRLIEQRMKAGLVSLDQNSEGSYFSANASKDADLAAYRSLFEVQ
jgi:hypothetical protein